MSLASRCVNTVSTKRAVVASGKRQNPTANLTGLKCTNLYPADSGRAGALVAQGVLQSIVNAYETILLGNHDIRPGDLLVVESVEYVIHGAAPWQFPSSVGYFMQLTVEKILQ
jgi:hypothetical protein